MQKNEISVLIVSAESEYRTSLSFELKSRGFKTAMATSAAKARILFPDLPFSVIVADLAEASGGLELLQFVRENKRPTHVILSFPDAELNPESLIKQGASWAVRKPFSPDLLRDKIHKLLNLADAFHYYLNVRRSLTIASLVGHLRAQDGEVLAQCQSAVASGQPKYVVLNLHDFKDYDPILANDLINFQKKMRELPATLLLCGIAQELRERLASKGLIVESEVLPSIKEALQHLLTIGMK